MYEFAMPMIGDALAYDQSENFSNSFLNIYIGAERRTYSILSAAFTCSFVLIRNIEPRIEYLR